MDGFNIRRIGIIMSPEPGNDLEIECVLNPAAVRGPDGNLYLFPRLVGKGNYSRIGLARVLFDEEGEPIGVKRMGIAPEPTMKYDLKEADVSGTKFSSLIMQLSQ